MQLSTVHLGLNRYDKLSTKMIISTENSYPWQNHIDLKVLGGKKNNFLLQLKTKIRNVLTKGYRCEWA